MFLLQVLPVLGLYSAPPKLKHFQFQTATAEVAATFPTARKGLSRGAASAVCVFRLICNHRTYIPVSTSILRRIPEGAGRRER